MENIVRTRNSQDPVPNQGGRLETVPDMGEAEWEKVTSPHSSCLTVP